MENAVDALKIAFAVIVFTLALSLTMVMFTQARETSDIVLQASDVSEFIEYISVEDYQEGTSRIVGMETIIPTLYNYYRENYTVVFLDSDGSYLELYNTQTDPTYWSDGYINQYYGGTDTRICSFDANEEESRREPWTTSGSSGNTVDYYVKLNMDCFLSAGTFTSPSGNGIDYNYASSSVHGWSGGKSFIEEYGNRKFKEYLGYYVYNQSSSTTESSEYAASSATTSQQTKRVIVYRLISNGD